ncbi:hypothetical protein A6E15_11310 [Natrinema saccharevitans]|uniref:Uncharacterized protein n=1 Tax=Natrinema saccharevitans TaxID=301967 RepID=A0A1S8AXF7_9EURY|nr:hypothetical protein [Natrinema saccharevitans]OLZ41533.1 hypothetical protein A6E15_11310 [Natrinema saccharevitans]
MIGSLEDRSIVEVVAGIECVGDGFFDLFDSPGEAFDLVSGFGFQLPMLENATTGLGNASSGANAERPTGRHRSVRDARRPATTAGSNCSGGSPRGGR